MRYDPAPHDLNHPGLDPAAVSPDVDLGPERPPDHFDHGNELDLLPLPEADR